VLRKTSLLMTVATLTFGVTAAMSVNSVFANGRIGDGNSGVSALSPTANYTIAQNDVDHPKHHFRNHKNKHKPHKPITKKHHLKHRHVKQGDSVNFFTQPEHSSPSGGCPGECRKS